MLKYEQWLKSLPIDGPFKLEPLYQGVANQVFKVQGVNETFILKGFCHDQPYGLDREQEMQLQSQLARHGIAPEVLHFDASRGLSLQSYIAEPDLKDADLDDAERIRRLAETLSRIHTLRVDAPIWSLHERVGLYLQRLSEFDADRARQFKQRIKAFRSLFDAWGANPVFCHNDLALHHIFTSDPIQVIDWEYSGYGERLFDIANSVVVNKLTPPQVQSLSNAYAGFTGLSLDLDQLQSCRKLVETINQLWFELYHQLQRHE